MSAKNKTKHADFYRLCQWINGHKDRLLRERPTLEEATVQASKDLGFPIGSGTLATAKQATGVAWTGLMPTNATGRGTKGRAARDAQFRALASAVIGFYHKLGEPVPQSLIAEVAKDANDGGVLPEIGRMNGHNGVRA